MSWADLSFVLPVTSIGYVVVALLGRFLLHENVSSERWLGIFLILCGAILVGSSNHERTAVHKTKEVEVHPL